MIGFHGRQHSPRVAGRKPSDLAVSFGPSLRAPRPGRRDPAKGLGTRRAYALQADFIRERQNETRRAAPPE